MIEFKKRVMKRLHQAVESFVDAPISATLIGLCLVAAFLATGSGRLELSLLWIILANQWRAERVRFIEKKKRFERN